MSKDINLNEIISLVNRHFHYRTLSVTGNVFLWQEISSSDRKNFPMTENFVQWRERSSFNRRILPVTRNFFLWQEIASCDRKFLAVTGYFLLWQEISSCHRKFLLVTGNSFLSQEISSCGMKFLIQNFSPGQDISGMFHPSDIKSQKKCVIFVLSQNCDESEWFLFKTSPESSNFLPRFLASLPLKSRPGWDIPDMDKCCLDKFHRDSWNLF